MSVKITVAKVPCKEPPRTRLLRSANKEFTKKKATSQLIPMTPDQLNTNREAYKEEFEEKLSAFIREKEKRILGTKPKFFTKTTYDTTVAYLKKKNEKKDSTQKASGNFNQMDQFKWDENNQKLYRLRNEIIKEAGGRVSEVKYEELGDEAWIPVFQIDDGLTFDRINKMHWVSDKPQNHVCAQNLFLNVSAKYGQNIPKSVCEILVDCCPVCKKRRYRKHISEKCVKVQSNTDKFENGEESIGFKESKQDIDVIDSQPFYKEWKLGSSPIEIDHIEGNIQDGGQGHGKDNVIEKDLLGENIHQKHNEAMMKAKEACVKKKVTEHSNDPSSQRYLNTVVHTGVHTGVHMSVQDEKTNKLSNQCYVNTLVHSGVHTSVQDEVMMKTKEACIRKKVTQHSNVTKLGTLVNRPINQCYVISVFQLLLGIKELWKDIKDSCTSGMNEMSITEVIKGRPFSSSSLIMGGLLKNAVKKVNTSVNMSVLFTCRMRNIEEMGETSQEDASEYMGYFINALINENPGGRVGSNLMNMYSTRRKCICCGYNFKLDNVEEPYFYLSIPEKCWEEQRTTMQSLIMNAFNNTISLKELGQCPTCADKDGSEIKESTKILETSNDILFVVKRYHQADLLQKKELSIECYDSVTVPVTSNGHCNELTFFLRSVVCHSGDSYKRGHYRCFSVESFIENGIEKTTYHELDDDQHFVLGREQFEKNIKTEGYIYHYSRRKSGNLMRNHYEVHSSDYKSMKNMELSFLTLWKKESHSRKVKKHRSITQGCDELFAYDLDKCWNLPQQICMKWETSCENCKKRYPTEANSEKLCFIGYSSRIKQSGLFASVNLPKNTFIAKYSGQKVRNGSEGRYVVALDDILIDASNTKCLAKYCNHSCDPNCVLQKVSKDIVTKKVNSYGNDEFETQLWIKTVKFVKKKTELFYHYGDSFHFEGDCLCGSCPI